jgi:hypothetical protein
MVITTIVEELQAPLNKQLQTTYEKWIIIFFSNLPQIFNIEITTCSKKNCKINCSYTSNNNKYCSLYIKVQMPCILKVLF